MKMWPYVGQSDQYLSKTNIVSQRAYFCTAQLFLLHDEFSNTLKNMPFKLAI